MTVELALEHLLDLCLEKNSKDNMTVVLVLFKNAPKWETERVVRRRMDEATIEAMLKEKEEVKEEEE